MDKLKALRRRCSTPNYDNLTIPNESSASLKNLAFRHLPLRWLPVCSFCASFPWHSFFESGAECDRDSLDFSIKHPLKHSSTQRSFSNLLVCSRSCHVCRHILFLIYWQEKLHIDALLSADSRDLLLDATVVFKSLPSESPTWVYPTLQVLLMLPELTRSIFFRVYNSVRPQINTFTANPAVLDDVRPSHPPHLDYGLIRRWMSECEKHGRECRVNPDRFVCNVKIRLIDVDRRCLVDRNTWHSYVALSYVRGQCLSGDRPLHTKNALKLYAPGSLSFTSIPKTIRDAIEVTRELGFRFLWVDYFCIVHDDQEERLRHISNMHYIFGQSQLTIVAAAGTSVRSGLPGTSKTPRRASSHQLLRVNKMITLAQVSPQELESNISHEFDLEGTAWARRAWTFQEMLLSRRLLVFTESGTLWSCRLLRATEDGTADSRCPDDSEPMLGLDISVGQPPAWLRDELISLNFHRLVEQYTARHLSCAEDRLHAFQGLLNEYTDHHHPWPFRYAHSITTFLEDLHWACQCCCNSGNQDGLDHTIREEISSGSSSSGKDDKSSKPVYPSWSWLGWQGPVRWGSYQLSTRKRLEPYKGEYAIPDNSVYTFNEKWGAIELSRNMVLSERKWRKITTAISLSFLDNAKFDHYIAFEAFYKRCFVAKDLLSISVSPGPAAREQHWDAVESISFCVTSTPDGYTSDHGPSKWLQRPQAGFELSNRRLDLLYLGFVKIPHVVPRFPMLLVCWKKGIAQRVGLVELNTADFELVRPQMKRSIVCMC